MVTNAKGQLGGLETTEAVRLRLAAESPAFKCHICQKTNSEIIKECEQRAKEAGTPSDDIEVPEELNMGFKDEMEASAATAKQDGGAKDNGAETTAQLAEGFVQTVPVVGNAGSTSLDTAASNVAARARPAQSVPQPTRTVPATPSQRQQPPQQQQQQPVARQAADDGIPVWIDRLIVILVVFLAALVLKLLFAA